MSISRVLTLILLIFQMCLADAHAQSSLRPPAEKNLARDIYKQFVETQSAFTTGKTTPVVEAAVARLKAAGFSDDNIFVGGPVPEKANLVVRYVGTGNKEPILLLAHIDVVEAKKSDWGSDPFKFVERDGYFYGRGTEDDKAQAAVWIANLIQFKREGFVPDRDIIVALTADEEGNSAYNGVEWLLKNHKNLINAEFALNEGGFSEMSAGKKVVNNIQISEKYILNFRLEVRNKGGHSSLPVADNAIYRLANALEVLSAFNFPLKTNPITSAYFLELSKIDNTSLKTDLAQVAGQSQESMRKIAAASPLWNASLRSTCIPTMLRGGHAMNALPQLAVANINCRVLPSDSPTYIQQALKNAIADPNVLLTQVNSVSRGPDSPIRSDLLTAVTNLTHSFWPHTPTIPFMVMGATDGRFLRAAGIPTYGISGFFTDRNDIRAHGKDERMSVQSFYEGQAFLYSLVKRLSKPAG